METPTCLGNCDKGDLFNVSCTGAWSLCCHSAVRSKQTQVMDLKQQVAQEASFQEFSYLTLRAEKHMYAVLCVLRL